MVLPPPRLLLTRICCSFSQAGVFGQSMRALENTKPAEKKTLKRAFPYSSHGWFLTSEKRVKQRSGRWQTMGQGWGVVAWFFASALAVTESSFSQKRKRRGCLSAENSWCRAILAMSGDSLAFGHVRKPIGTALVLQEALKPQLWWCPSCFTHCGSCCQGAGPYSAFSRVCQTQTLFSKVGLLSSLLI